MNFLMQHRRILCCFFFAPVLFYPLNSTVAVEDLDESPLDTRYDRVIVKVPVADVTLEARREALAAAHQQALSIWLESLLGEVNQESKHYFSGRVRQYVMSSDVLSETALAHKGELEIEVYLDKDRLRFDVASLLFPSRPVASTALIIMGQGFLDAKYTTRLDDVGPSMLTKLFSDNGFVLNTQAELDAVYSHEDILRCIRSGSAIAAQFARAVRMDIAIVGEVRTGTIEQAGSQGKIKAFADVLIVRASDSMLLDRIQAEAVVAGDDATAVSRMAAEDAMFKVQQRVLVAAALGMLDDTPGQWTHCVIRGENIKRISSKIVQYLESKSAIDSLELSRKDRNALVFDLSYSGKTSALIEALSKKTGEAYWLEPVTVIKGEMFFNLRVRDQPVL